MFPFVTLCQTIRWQAFPKTYYIQAVKSYDYEEKLYYEIENHIIMSLILQVVKMVLTYKSDIKSKKVL